MLTHKILNVYAPSICLVSYHIMSKQDAITIIGIVSLIIVCLPEDDKGSNHSSKCLIMS